MAVYFAHRLAGPMSSAWGGPGGASGRRGYPLAVSGDSGRGSGQGEHVLHAMARPRLLAEARTDDLPVRALRRDKVGPRVAT